MSQFTTYTPTHKTQIQHEGRSFGTPLEEVEGIRRKKKLRPERPDALDALDVLEATATAYAFLTRSVMAFDFWTQLSRRLRSDTTATAYAFRTRSVRASAIWMQRASSGRRMSWRTATGRRLSWHQASRRSCHSTENRSEALNHIRILGVATYSSCIHYI